MSSKRNFVSQRVRLFLVCNKRKWDNSGRRRLTGIFATARLRPASVLKKERPRHQLPSEADTEAATAPAGLHDWQGFVLGQNPTGKRGEPGRGLEFVFQAPYKSRHVFWFRIDLRKTDGCLTRRLELLRPEPTIPWAETVLPASGWRPCDRPDQGRRRGPPGRRLKPQ